MKQALTKGMVLVAVILMDILAGAEVDLFVPSFPELQSHFNLSPFWVEALLSVNFAGFCISLFFVGALADRYGRKPVILAGLMVFTLGTVSCLLAPSYHLLLAGRFLQGAGVAAPATLCFLIIADSYPLKQQQFLFGILNGLINSSVAAAPIVGCYITMYFHWEGNFVALLILGLVTLFMTMCFTATNKLPEHRETLSLRGYIPIFKSKPLMLVIVHMVCSYLPWWIFIGISPLLYIKDLGVSLSQFGYYQGTWAFVFAVGSILAGLIIGRYDQKKMLFISGLICIAGLITVSIAAFSGTANPLFITVALLPLSIGTIIPSIIIYPLCLNYMPEVKGKVAAIMQGSRLVFAALGLQLAGYFYDGSFQNIGIILLAVFSIATITIFFIIRNNELMNFNIDS